MSRCPFHAASTGTSQEGEIESIQCADCGEYRISKTALERITGSDVPAGWTELVGRREVVSTRDTRTLLR